jgi:hypothetical protein
MFFCNVQSKAEACKIKNPFGEKGAFCTGTAMGLEPTTLGTTNRCSDQLSYAVHKIGLQMKRFFLFIPKATKRNLTQIIPVYA